MEDVMFEVIWPARQERNTHRRGGLEWEPGQIRPYKTKDDIPKDIQNDPGFIIREVAYSEERIDPRARPEVMTPPAGFKVTATHETHDKPAHEAPGKHTHETHGKKG